MGRAGGGGRVGGGRSGGGSFSGGGRPGGSSFGGGRPGGFGGGPHHHRPPHPIHHRPPRPIFHRPFFWGMPYGGRTVIINNGTSNEGSSTRTDWQTQTEAYEDKPLTDEQKMYRAECLAKEARDAKKKAGKTMLTALLFIAIGVLFGVLANKSAYEKVSLEGTVYAGYAKDEGFTYNGGKTEAACERFYKKTGIPLFFYTAGTYSGEASTCDDYTMQLYDELFSDENHVLIAYYESVDYWSWAIGETAKFYMNEDKVNDLIDKIYYYGDNYYQNNDAVFAAGIEGYADDLTEKGGGMQIFSWILYIIGGFILLGAILSYVSSNKEEKRYNDEAETFRTRQKFGRSM